MPLIRAMLAVVLSWSLIGPVFFVGQEPMNAKYVALLVGVNCYNKLIFSQLNDSERDVDELAKELQALGFDITVLKESDKGDSQATRENIHAGLQRLTRPLGADDVMLVMFSGDGRQIETNAVCTARRSIH